GAPHNGKGFAFLGSRYHLEVAGKDYYLDILFYHYRLRRFVVFDLKTTKFKPEYAGKMNFYLTAVDELLRHPDDKPSLGIILCNSHNAVTVDYALRDMRKSMGVAEYRVTGELPDQFHSKIPTAEDFVEGLKSRRKLTSEYPIGIQKKLSKP
ncbi:MAG: PDDEXK nuclease domain-containing protein, partial [Hyphomicrobiaceae bacterium]